MRLTLWISSLFLVIILGGGFLFIKFTSPLEIGTISSTDENHTALIGVGNKGFSKIRITEVLINNNEVPDTLKLQVSNLKDGFDIANEYNSDEVKGISVKKIDEVLIDTGISPAANFEKSDQGTATKNDIIYGISITHSEVIQEVDLTYKYFGMSFEKSILITPK